MTDESKTDDAKAAKVDVKIESGRAEEVDVGPPKKRTLKERLKEHLEEYGKVALITYITLSLLTRFRSRQEDSFSAKVLAALRNEFGGHAVHTK